MSDLQRCLGVFLAILVILLVTVGQAPAATTYVITNARGGIIEDYITKAEIFQNDGTSVVIDGRCDSGEKCWIVPFDEMARLEAALSPENGGA